MCISVYVFFFFCICTSYDYRWYVRVRRVSLSKIYGLPMTLIFCVQMCTVRHTICLTETKKFDAAAITRSVCVYMLMLTLSKAVFDDLFAGWWDALRKHHLELDQQVTTMG